MAKAKMPVQLPVRLYTVVDAKVGTKLGPHPVLQQGGDRVVALNEKQAKYYLTVGAITER